MFLRFGMLKTKADDIGTEARFMRRRAVEHATGLPRGTLWQYVSEGRFPKPLHL
jgi:predicted DNA-binding transcriptional regulator AlpA